MKSKGLEGEKKESVGEGTGEKKEKSLVISIYV